MNLSFRYLALEVFAVGRRIILDSVRSAGTAVDFVAGFLGSLCSVSLEYFVVKAVSYMKM